MACSVVLLSFTKHVRIAVNQSLRPEGEMKLLASRKNAGKMMFSSQASFAGLTIETKMNGDRPSRALPIQNN